MWLPACVCVCVNQKNTHKNISKAETSNLKEMNKLVKCHILIDVIILKKMSS